MNTLRQSMKRWRWNRWYLPLLLGSGILILFEPTFLPSEHMPASEDSYFHGNQETNTGSTRPSLDRQSANPNCQPEGSRFRVEGIAIPLETVHAATYKIPAYLKAWVPDSRHEVIIEQPFQIMRREVAEREYRQFVATLSPADQERILYDTPSPQNPGAPMEWHPASSVPWWAAEQYAEWLSHMTNCKFDLPTYQQWLASAVLFGKPEKANLRNPHKVKPDELIPYPQDTLHLLGNLDEWAKDACGKGGHYLLGSDFRTKPNAVARIPICKNRTMATIGFRVVREVPSNSVN